MMNKAYLTIGVLAAASALSICDLCDVSPAELRGARAPEATALVAAVRSPAIDPTTVTLHIEGMTCGGCVIGVRKVLERLAGVQKAEVSYEKQRAVVTYDPDKVTVEQLIEAIKTLKYKATVVTT
jgi:mercuric transport protein